ncbi:hypothetical protein [Streptomyces sp. NPDC089799]|uniref:hypothetical protein n=1 Tax=Streptomyces sp. NPDC089799 TaxID=3155066 RepID=UPI003442B3D9
MKHGEGEDALVLEAREMLAAGQSKEEVFAELAARTGDWDACALALCLALGVSRPDAEARIHETRPLFDEFEAGEEDIVAMLLACGHVFVVEPSAGRSRRADPQPVVDCRLRPRRLSWRHDPLVSHGELTKIFLLFTPTQ